VAQRPDEGIPPPAPEPPQPTPALPPVTAIALETEGVATAEPLTARERDVLGLLSFGYSNADIAETLVLSEGTVKTHVKRVLGKLGVHNRTEAALYARDHNVTYSPPAEEAPVVSLTRRAP
jgi:DNA-binding NarL/FixJ family response regulator